MKFVRAALAAVFMTAPSGVPVLADDRPPTLEERGRIESALKEAGFVGWDGIEFDDGVWEVDDAIHSDGRECDLHLAPGTFEIIDRDPDQFPAGRYAHRIRHPG